MWRWFLSRSLPFCCVHIVKPIQLPLIILLWSLSISKTAKSSNNAGFQFPGRLFLVLERSENSLVAAYWWQFDWVDCNNCWSNEFFRQTSSYLSTPFNSRLKTSNQRSIILFYAAWMGDCEKERSQIDTHHFIINEALLMWQRKSLFRVFSSIMHAIFSVRGLAPSTSLSAYWTPSSPFLSLSPPLSLSLFLCLPFIPVRCNLYKLLDFKLVLTPDSILHRSDLPPSTQIHSKKYHFSVRTFFFFVSCSGNYWSESFRRMNENDVQPTRF